MNIREEVLKMKKTAPLLAASFGSLRNAALQKMIETLNAHSEEIMKANRKDLENADRQQIPAAIKNRLKFNEKKLNDVTEGIRQLILLEDPVGKCTLKRELDNDLLLQRITCPIGVIGVIFEARPDALVQIASLCIKSGNCAILKGGKETTFTNRILFQYIHDSIIEAGLSGDCLMQVEQHSEIDELLACHDCIDLLIPRGSNRFVQYIMNNTKIPVMGHADGICHIYADKAADFEKSIPIIIDAKTQYPAACNAVETILVHREIAGEFLPLLHKAFAEHHVNMRGTEEVSHIIPVEVIDESEFKEYLDLTASIKIVADIDEAIDHINRHGSHHTDCILTEDDAAAHRFMQMVDSASVYQNCSTRFADGFRYGFGAEVGISTGKIHARGPVGLEGLVTYKYMVTGHGNIADDYITGRRSFHFNTLTD